ncbi:MAG: HAMP domain-containing histidine kinase [Deltaproteobacteria bacterium]|nr:HAMP domain-containing histidine kinase [Deltaproteobacteria bacterium]
MLPAIVISACVLGYFAYQTAAQLIQLGEKSIAYSILLLVEDRVKQVESQIISADNEVFNSLDLEDPDNSVISWRAKAETISPSIRAVVILRSKKEVVSYAARASGKDTKRFLHLFLRQIVPALELEKLPVGRLKHLHRSFQGSTYLISYKAIRHQGERYYLAAHQDTGYLVREVFPKLFSSDSTKQLYNIINEDNKLIYGPSLARAGDYLVGYRFPTTLYTWRLQVAPPEVQILKSKVRTSRFNQAALIGLSLGIILLGTLFILFAADKERRLNALKSEFIANVSHELKTPLSVIRMFGEMLLTGRFRSPEKQQEYVENICSEAERLSGLIENVLDFALLERGKPHYQMQDCNLYDLVARAIENFHYRFERERADVRLVLLGEIPLLRVDEQAIMLSVINLLDNAVKYGAATPIEVTVEVFPGEIQIRVRDHGPGIPPGDLRRIFERFYRTRRNPKVRGTGIGLTLVKQTAEAHMGRAWAENAPDGGAIVGFAIPRDENTQTVVLRDKEAKPKKQANVNSIPQGAH